MYVCLCRGVTDQEIRSAVLGGAESMKAVRLATQAMTQCGKCARLTKEIVTKTLSDKAEKANKDQNSFYEVA